ncbi:PDZ domain-containing protein 4 [Merluccius polli]|uniref:PDZ domain-containing protein 4 n=1 Tax=Merluccius polli TaxID=89951 RepID=A0AA47NAN3_MERPO|nr:PDZ domain-containing protein 4 [Merluccius polli]
MGCNMCVVKRPEEQYRILFQHKGYNNSLRPLDGNEKVRGRRLSQLPLDRPQKSQDAMQAPGSARRGHRRKGGAEGVSVTGTDGDSPSTVAMVTIPDCIDNGTQTEISFQNLLTLGRGGRRQHHDPPSSRMGPYDLNPLVLDSNHGDCVSISQHGEDRHQMLEYEEVCLYKSSQEEKLGLTVCSRTDEEEDQGLYIGEVSPNSIAARNGRLQEGDRILQINGVDIQNRDEAVAILSREDSINLFLLLARPEVRVVRVFDSQLTHRILDTPGPPPSPSSRRPGEEEKRGGGGEELDSGVGQSSDLLEQSSTCYTNTTSTPGSLAMPRPSPRPSPGHGRENAPPSLLHLRDLQLSSDSLLGLDWGSGPGYSPHHHQPNLSMMMMVPRLTEDECERYEELLEIKCQYERTAVAARSSHLLLTQEEAGGARDGGGPEEEEEQEVLSQREVALMEEELRHLEFKCRNILRAQKMQQLRERCLKTWTQEEETVLTNNNEEEDDDDENEDSRQELSAINEVPERERLDERDSSYHTGGESCQNTPLVSTEQAPPLPRGEDEEDKRGRGAFSPPPPLLLQLNRLPPLTSPLPSQRPGRERRHSNLNYSFSPNSYRKYQTANSSPAHGSSSTPPTPSKFRSLSREVGSNSRRAVVYGGRSSRTGGAPNSPESSPSFSLAPRLERYHSCLALPSEGLGGRRGEGGGEGREGSGPVSPRSVSSAPCGLEEHRRYHGPASRLGLALPLGLPREAPPPTSSLTSLPRTEWKVKVRSDGTRYVAKRPVRDRLLKERALKIREERSGTTTDDDAASEMKQTDVLTHVDHQGRYWSREERKQQLLRAREYRRRREFMMQSRLDYSRSDRECCSSLPGGGDQPPQPCPQQEVPGDNILLLSQRRKVRKRSRRILDHWVTIQGLLAHGTRSPDGTRIYNARLSVTTV